MSNRTSTSFSSELDERLLKAVQNPKYQKTEVVSGTSSYTIKWAAIARSEFKTEHFKTQKLFQRYNRCLRPELRHGEWSADEDALLLRLVEEKGPCWAEISKEMNYQRADVWCRQRYFRLQKQGKVKRKIEHKTHNTKKKTRRNSDSSSTTSNESEEEEEEFDEDQEDDAVKGEQDVAPSTKTESPAPRYFTRHMVKMQQEAMVKEPKTDEEEEIEDVNDANNEKENDGDSQEQEADANKNAPRTKTTRKINRRSPPFSFLRRVTHKKLIDETPSAMEQEDTDDTEENPQTLNVKPIPSESQKDSSNPDEIPSIGYFKKKDFFGRFKKGSLAEEMEKVNSDGSA